MAPRRAARLLRQLRRALRVRASPLLGGCKRAIRLRRRRSAYFSGVKGDPIAATRAGYAEFNAGDVDALSARLVSDFQWHEAAEIPGPKSCEDREEFIRFMRGFDRLWEEFSFEPLEMIPAASSASPPGASGSAQDELVYVKVRARGVGKASAEPVDFLIHHVWRLRDGLFARMDAYLEEYEARDAAGLS